MFIASLLSLSLALIPFAAAQQVHNIQVGAGGQFTFSPEAIFADAGDTVVFHFNPKNHSAVQSSFANPCGPKDGGFNSGFMPVAAGSTAHATFTVTVPDKEPIWVYCAQAAGTAASHCGRGMVFAVNCGPEGAPNSFTNFKAAALAVGASLQGGASAGSPTSVYTAAYGGVTIPPPQPAAEVTQTITLGSSTWATTYTSYADSPAPTPASLTGAVHKVIVGGPGKLLFDPTHISALPRDTVVFEFRQKNHTVTQSSFPDPCRKLTVNGQAIGFDSGFWPVAADATEFPTWSLKVNDTAPIWAYCRQTAPTSHCGAGMVFAINSDEAGPRNYAAFLKLAQTLNGTALGAAASPTSTSTPNSASPVHAAGPFALALAAAVVAALV